jgi:hypothetical protein
VGISDLGRLYGEPRHGHTEHGSLTDRGRRQQEAYGRRRRARQLQSFLQGYEIRRATIKGMGRHKQAILGGVPHRVV